MKVVRFILQAAIVLFGGTTLLAFSRSARFDLPVFLGLAAFFSLLFVCTLWLREQNQNPKISAALLALLGAAACVLAASILNGYSGPPNRRGTLLRVAIEVLGVWPVAAFFIVTGVAALWAAYGTWQKR